MSVPPSDARRSAIKIVLTSLILVAVIVGLIFLAIYQVNKHRQQKATQTTTYAPRPATPPVQGPPQFPVGSCAQLRPNGPSSAAMTPGNCNDNTGPLRIMEVYLGNDLGQCHAPIKYNDPAGRVVYCMQANFIVGQCYARSRIIKDFLITPPTCDDRDAFFVERLLPDPGADPAQCGGSGGDDSFSMKNPPQIVCIRYAQGSRPK